MSKKVKRLLIAAAAFVMVAPARANNGNLPPSKRYEINPDSGYKGDFVDRNTAIETCQDWIVDLKNAAISRRGSKTTKAACAGLSANFARKNSLISAACSWARRSSVHGIGHRGARGSPHLADRADAHAEYG
jgi:hypothetical protein